MPAKHKRGAKRPKPQRQQQQPKPSQQSSHDQQQPSPQHLTPNDPSKLQISSAQAEIYFEYLRKKITHQTNDPFSLPFLNLKFQQLQQSWKGATEQLNLQSRIYCMRVDNCHDYTIKMLNFVIRNQEEQIGQLQSKTVPISSTSSFLPNTGDNSLQYNSQSQSQINFNSNLQKAQKLIITTIQQDKNLLNHSLWRVIFKKSQTLQQIQLNTLELSNDLSLQIDDGKKYVKGSIDIDEQEHRGDSLFAQSTMSSLAFASQKLAIFKQINSIKSQINMQIQQILQYSQNRQKHQTIEQPLYFGYTQLDFDGLYEEFDQFTRFQQHDQRVGDQKKDDFNLVLEDHCRDDVFVGVNCHRGELYEIPIHHLNIVNSQVEEFQQHEENDDDASVQGDLYEPHKDILFHSTIKKRNAQKRQNDVKIYGKRKKNHKTLIDFDNPAIGVTRKAVFKQRKEVRNNIQNDNLVPINYVVLYEHRNPFRRHRKVVRTSNRISFYENLQGHPLMDCCDLDNLKCRQSFHQIKVTQSQQEPFLIDQPADPFNHHSNMLQVQNPNIQRPYKNVSMKTVKNEIQKEIHNVDESAINVSNKIVRTSNYSNFSHISDTSAMDSYLEDQGVRIGLKFLKHKMVNYDPLDILMSMLHVAYENQVLLEPVYASFGHSTTTNDANMKLRDIVIQGPSIS